VANFQIGHTFFDLTHFVETDYDTINFGKNMKNDNQKLGELLLLGWWGINLYPLTEFARKEVLRYKNANTPFIVHSASNQYPYLLLAEHPLHENKELLNLFPKHQEATWDEFIRTSREAYRHYERMQLVSSNEGKENKKWFSFSWSENKAATKENQLEAPLGGFHFLVTERVDGKMKLAILTYSLALATNWHIQEGGLCLHSSAVASPYGGILFLGNSGFGKSTVTRLTMEKGYEVLGDDLNFIRYINEEYFLKSGPSVRLIPGGYSHLVPPLRGIFVLKQDTQDHLIPLSKTQTAQSLFDSLKQTPYATRLSNLSIKQAFQTIGSIARRTPAYELHFRKSPDFWELIGEQFSD
jgi:hypothetical protein